MTRPTRTNVCAMSDCCKSLPADHGLMCAYHRAQDDRIMAIFAPSPTVQASMGDECGCTSCRSDLAGLVPCEGEEGDHDSQTKI